jgi:hypothetical protein
MKGCKSYNSPLPFSRDTHYEATKSHSNKRLHDGKSIIASAVIWLHFSVVYNTQNRWVLGFVHRHKF